MFAPVKRGENAFDKRSRIADSIIDTIGATPLLSLNRLCCAEGISGKRRLLLKLEYFSPGHSKKDRVALSIIQHAKSSGILSPGQPVVELTSGNTGAGLALVCRALGHPFIAVISQGNSPERATMMRAFGAEIVAVDQAPGGRIGEVSGADIDLVEEEAERVTIERGAFRADQFGSEYNALAHELGTAVEIIQQVGGRKIGAYCDFVGTGGMFAGCSRALKRHDPSIKCYIVEPDTTAVYAGMPVTCGGAHPIQGGGYSRPDLPQLVEIVSGGMVDGHVQVSGEEAIAMQRRLAKEEGVFCGVSGGANVAAAMRLLRDGKVGEGEAVVTAAPDSGFKYLSSGIWD
jgi:cysteine synthase A